mgnify:CR=1 FL=1
MDSDDTLESGATCTRRRDNDLRPKDRGGIGLRGIPRGQTMPGTTPVNKDRGDA